MTRFVCVWVRRLCVVFCSSLLLLILLGEGVKDYHVFRPSFGIWCVPNGLFIMFMIDVRVQLSELNDFYANFVVKFVLDFFSEFCLTVI